VRGSVQGAKNDAKLLFKPTRKYYRMFNKKLYPKASSSRGRNEISTVNYQKYNPISTRLLNNRGKWDNYKLKVNMTMDKRINEGLHKDPIRDGKLLHQTTDKCACYCTEFYVLYCKTSD
jgi:hypothetical protein